MKRVAARRPSRAPFARVRRAGVCGLSAIALVAPVGTRAEEPARAADAPASAAAATTTTTTTTVTTTTVTTVVPVPAPQESLPAWTLALPADEPVPFHGIVNMDKAGYGGGAMLYPTAGLGVLGLLVGVATHAALVGGARSSQESRMQQDADKVLDPYRGVLAGFHQRDLAQRALALTPSHAVAHLHEAKDTPAGELFVQAQPLYAMTPDASALMLDETVVIRTGAASDKGTQQVIRIISAPRVEEDVQAAWMADNGAALKLAASAMQAEALDIALAQMRHPVDDKMPFRTLRYALGDAEKMERGQLVAETCDHLVIRTLRGGFMVVPHKAAAELPAGCPAAPVIPQRIPAAAPAASAPASAATAAMPAASTASAAAS
jgi:hypothetical protein